MPRTVRVLVLALALAALTSGCALVGRASVPGGGGPSTAPSYEPALSGDGRVVAFTSFADDVVAGDTNGVADVFVRDLVAGATSRASVGSGGGQLSAASGDAAVSGDGRVVAFVTADPSAVPGDTNGVADVFVRDLVAGTTTRASVSSSGAQASGVSGEPAVSGDGRYVAFVSSATDLVPGDTNGVADVFVRDLVAGTTTRVSGTAGGAAANGASSDPAISPSGNWIAYVSTATNLVSGDSNGVADVFLAARAGGTVRRASSPDAITRPFQQSNGASANPSVTDPLDGYLGGGQPLVAYESRASNLAGTDRNGSAADVFVTTSLFGSVARTVRLTEGTGASTEPVVGGVAGQPGFTVAFSSVAPEYAPAGSDVLAVRRDSPVATDGITRRLVSTDTANGPADGQSGQPSTTADGQFVAFTSLATDLGQQVASGVGDVFVSRTSLPTVSAIDPTRVALLQTRDLTISGSGFSPGTQVWMGDGVTVNSVTVVSSTQIVVNVTPTVATPDDRTRDVLVATPGSGGASAGAALAGCQDCYEVAAVVEQPGPVSIELTSGTIEIGSISLDLPSCPLGFCPSIGATVDTEGALTFGLDSIALDPIPVPLEIFPGVETTVAVTPTLTAPAGQVVPVNGAISLSTGLALRLGAPLLPSTCALGPVALSLSAGPGGSPLGVPYEQVTGTALLAGGFTDQLALTGCGFLTGALNAALGLPIPLEANAVTIGVRLDPVLTGTAEP